VISLFRIKIRLIDVSNDLAGVITTNAMTTTKLQTKGKAKKIKKLMDSVI